MTLASKLRDGASGEACLVGDRGWKSLAKIAAIQPFEATPINPGYDSGSVDDDGIGHVYIQGLLGRNLTDWDRMWGATDYRDIEDDIASVLDAGAGGIVFHVDSPGGLAEGADETAELIGSLEIPTLAWVDMLAASAGYWLAAGADIVTGPRGASYGSIGAYIPFVDMSKAWEAMGLEFRPILSPGADLKLAGAGPSMSDEQREHLQESVDEIMAGFRAHVTAYRAPDELVWRAGLYRGERAEQLGLSDGPMSYEAALDLLMDEMG
jgi:ClpP class serine protease